MANGRDRELPLLLSIGEAAKTSLKASMPQVTMNRVAAPVMSQNARLLGQQRHAVLPLKVEPWPGHAQGLDILCIQLMQCCDKGRAKPAAKIVLPYLVHALGS